MQTCKYCHSDKIVKHGVKANIQRYLCKNCNHHFYDNAVTFPRMRVDSHVIVTSLNMYYVGLSWRKVAEQLSNIFGEHVSQSTVWYWGSSLQRISRRICRNSKTSIIRKVSP